jgi:hypothetical protein
MVDISDKIKIKEVSSSAAEPLLQCYFKPKDDGTFNFHDKDDRLKRRDVTLGSEFSFVLDEVPGIWHLVLDQPTADPTVYGGIWKTGPEHDPSLADGTYQAEAGGSGEEEPNAASACA